MICYGDPGLVRPVYDNRIRQEPLRFSRDEWLNLVEVLGFTKTIVVELPLKDDHTGDVGIAQAHLRAARTAFAHGNLDDVGPRAYKAFEALVPWANGKRIFEAIKKAYLSQAEPNVATHGRDVLEPLFRLYHEGGRHHASGVPVARHHARFLLVAAEAVVAWCAELGVSPNFKRSVRKPRQRKPRPPKPPSPGTGTGQP